MKLISMKIIVNKDWLYIVSLAHKVVLFNKRDY